MKTALLTGISSDIGQAIAKALADHGWKVVGLYHQTKPAVADRVYQVDLSNLEATKRAAEQLTSELSGIDAFIHVASIWHNEDRALANETLSSFTSEQVIATMNVGVTSAMILCNQLLPMMKDGTIIGISGTFSDGAAGWLPYYTSKRALEDFLVGLSQDVPRLSVFGVSPADTATTPYKTFYPEYIEEAQSPAEIAKLILELLSGNSEFTSGEIIELRQGHATKGFHK